VRISHYFILPSEANLRGGSICQCWRPTKASFSLLALLGGYSSTAPIHFYSPHNKISLYFNLKNQFFFFFFFFFFYLIYQLLLFHLNIFFQEFLYSFFERRENVIIIYIFILSYLVNVVAIH
jgi:hypothetical protein